MTPFTTTDVVLVGKTIDKLHATIPEYRGPVRQVRRHPARPARPSIPTSCSRRFRCRRFEDINGKKIATAGAALQWVRGTGATPVREQHDALLQQRQDRRHRRFHHLPVLDSGMKFPEAAPYVTKVGFGAQYAAALIINKSVYDGLPPELQTILQGGGRRRGRPKPTRRSRISTMRAYGSVPEKFPGAQDFRLAARRAGQVGERHAEHRQGMGGAHRQAQGLAGHQGACRLHGRNAQGQAPNPSATGTRTEARRRGSRDIVGVGSTSRKQHHERAAPKPGAPRALRSSAGSRRR